MKKRARVHLLPTDDWQEIGTTLHARGNHDTNYTPHNIYITTDDEIKEDDTWINLDTNTIHNGNLFELANRVPSCKKIIATTYPELNLPQIPQSFIEEYCRAGGIDEVDVEYDYGLIAWKIEPKVTSNNEIIIHLIGQEKRDCLIAFDDWFNKNWYPEQYSILAIEAYLKTIQ